VVADRHRPSVGIRSPLAAGLAAAAIGAVACGEDLGLPPDTEAGVRFPLTVTALAGGRSVLVAGANFDRKYRGGKVRAFDTATERWSSESFEIPGFVGGVALQASATPSEAGAPLRYLATSRDTDDLTLAEVVTATAPLLRCGEIDDHGRCDALHRYGAPAGELPTLGSDPAGVEVVAWPGHGWRVHVAATGDGRLTVLELNEVGRVRELAAATLSPGLVAVTTVPATGRTYVSDARSPVVHVFRLADKAGGGFKVAVEPAVVLPSGGLRDYGRGMALAHDGGRLLVADRSPAALVAIDVAPDAVGVPRNTVVGVVPLGGQPSEVALAPTGPGGRELAYVSCYNDDAVWVVDWQLREVVARIALPHAAYGLAAVPAMGIHPATHQPRGWMLYAALFNGHGVVAIPIAPGAFDRHAVRRIEVAP